MQEASRKGNICLFSFLDVPPQKQLVMYSVQKNGMYDLFRMRPDISLHAVHATVILEINTLELTSGSGAYQFTTPKFTIIIHNVVRYGSDISSELFPLRLISSPEYEPTVIPVLV
jgi:hypothetical protein